MLTRIRSHIVSALVAVALVAVLSGAAAACPTCGAGIAEGDEASRAAVRGWFWSIVFMMSMPFLILGGLSAYMYVLIRRHRAEQDAVRAETGETEFERRVRIAMERSSRGPSSDDESRYASSFSSQADGSQN